MSTFDFSQLPSRPEPGQIPAGFIPRPTKEERQAQREARRPTPPEPKPVRKPLGVKKRMRILCRDKFTCQLCKRHRDQLPEGITLHVDHIVPWVETQDDRDENLRALCSECNLGRGWRPTP